MSARQRGLLLLTFCICCALPCMAQPASDILNGKSLESAASFAQSLGQWEFVMIGGSLLVLVGTSYRRPPKRLMRVPYLLFLFAWFFLGRSIYFGTRAQEVYLAYLLLPTTTIEEATKRLNHDIGTQISCLFCGLFFFSIWLAIYLFWWVFAKRVAEGQGDSCA